MKLNIKLNDKVRTSNESSSDYFKKFETIINDSRYGFFNLTQNQNHIENAKKVYSKYKDRKFFIQIGIGGSALGPQMLIDALGRSQENEFIFLDNTDSEDINTKLQGVDLKNSLFYVVSKSGGTAETVASFIICYNKLIEAGVSEADMNKYFVFSTDPEKGELRKLSNDMNYDSLEIPSNIGGRFSVLTSVGLLPALFANIDIDELYKGANDQRHKILKDKEDSDLFKLASSIMALYNDGIDQTILMPYSSKLKSLSHWFVQLWGESLGKIDSNGVSQGLTPIPAYGATDQHSQMQLFMEGKNDKFLILLEVANKKSNYSLKNNIPMDSAKKLNDFDLNSLISAQLRGTLKALSDRDRNTAFLTIDENNEYNMGQLILFFESLTALMGSYLNVDPFNQPGVELGKKYAFEYLNS